MSDATKKNASIVLRCGMLMRRQALRFFARRSGPSGIYLCKMDGKELRTRSLPSKTG
jgi:hypothetical protein